LKHDSQRELIARAVIIHEGALLVNWSRNQKTGENYCALPGGHVDPGESCVEALKREFQEELDADLDVRDLCFVSESIYAGRKAKDKTRHELVLYFHATPARALPEEAGTIHSPEQTKHFRWLPLADLCDANLLPPAIKEFLLRPDTTDPAPRYVFHDATRR